jgi:hypothetical protein
MKWINVTSGELPIDKQEVIICFINSAGRHVTQSTFKDFVFYYVSETPNGYFEEPFGVVTHWQPMPPLPELLTTP